MDTGREGRTEHRARKRVSEELLATEVSEEGLSRWVHFYVLKDTA